MPLNEHAKCLDSGDLDLADQESRKPVTQNDEPAERRPVTGTIAMSIGHLLLVGIAPTG